MGDTGVGEQALEIFLRQCGKVPDEKGQESDRAKNDSHLSDESITGQKRRNEAQENEKSRGLGTDGKECCDRGRSALVNIRNPKVKRSSAHFESEGDKDERKGKECGRGIYIGRGKRFLDAIELHGSRDSEKPGEAVDEEGGRESAEDEILHSRFQRSHIPPEIGHHDVEGNRDGFQRDKNTDEVVGRSHPHEAGAGEHGERKKFAQTRLRMGILFGTRRLRDHDRRVDRRHEEDQEGCDDRDPLEVERETVPRLVELPEDSVGRLGPFHREKKPEDHGETDHSEPGDGPLVFEFHEGIDHQHDETESDNDDF